MDFKTVITMLLNRFEKQKGRPMISIAAEKEMREAAHSESFRNDMKTVADSRHNPFIKDGNADVDAYIIFVSDFNAFINHAPKRFEPILDKDMRL
jgi:hypothetical protein